MCQGRLTSHAFQHGLFHANREPLETVVTARIFVYPSGRGSTPLSDTLASLIKFHPLGVRTILGHFTT